MDNEDFAQGIAADDDRSCTRRSFFYSKIYPVQGPVGTSER